MSNLDEKFIETIEAAFTSLMWEERVVSEDIVWLSMREVLEAVRQGKILSNNPEIELILKSLKVYHI